MTESAEYRDFRFVLAHAGSEIEIFHPRYGLVVIVTSDSDVIPASGGAAPAWIFRRAAEAYWELVASERAKIRHGGRS